jgi:uncharacterized FAD-dependent dehydrogenase
MFRRNNEFEENMLRLTKSNSPSTTPNHALRDAILARLGIEVAELLDFTVFKRSYDARKRSAIVLIYALDVRSRTRPRC